MITPTGASRQACDCHVHFSDQCKAQVTPLERLWLEALLHALAIMVIFLGA